MAKKQGPMTLLLLPQMVLHLVYIYKQLADNQWCLVVPPGIEPESTV